MISRKTFSFTNLFYIIILHLYSLYLLVHLLLSLLIRLSSDFPKNLFLIVCTSVLLFSLFLLTSLAVPYISSSRGPHAGPEEPGLQRDPQSAPEGGAGQDKEEAAGQRRPLHLGDGRGQVHAALLPHRLLAVL